jgi:hypothetical protein
MEIVMMKAMGLFEKKTLLSNTALLIIKAILEDVNPEQGGESANLIILSRRIESFELHLFELETDDQSDDRGDDHDEKGKIRTSLSRESLSELRGMVVEAGKLVS